MWVIMWLTCAVILYPGIPSKTDEDIPYVDTIFPLPSVDTEFIPLSVDLRLPAFGGVKSLLPLSYILQNRTPYPQELEVAMDTNDCFMFSGNKQVCSFAVFKTLQILKEQVQTKYIIVYYIYLTIYKTFTGNNIILCFIWRYFSVLN